ncbi:MAG: non-canonical purine NTP pyrophosphatase, RdgB/HAM1 family [Acidobacteria bacterium]|nr:non-canonical purine NTP pyrophosphatase, RdgB/HAM1 family [Acidobacteriota bacterium]|tara:strand:- start:1817 stop:2446 length:630 start_codon:yes stop_codon:yes gene_type:complete
MIPKPTEISEHRPRVLVATTNPGKLREIHKILGHLPIQLVTLDAYPSISDPEETGTTFAENAKLKACYYAHSTNELTVAEDSGLEIDALDGAPGVRSARFNGESYQEKFRTISKMLHERGRTTSTARFVCAVAVWLKDSMIWETIKTVEGRLKLPPQGDHGFGYDPIFYYPPYGRTLAAVSPTEKAAISHRGQAFRALRTDLKHILAKT